MEVKRKIDRPQETVHSQDLRLKHASRNNPDPLKPYSTMRSALSQTSSDSLVTSSLQSSLDKVSITKTPLYVS